ncbi:GNAT family N-acetyltransferase [Saccharibacillus sp. CPCC 101409]|uniref:GNAT family N-acetyltransferase n=1 Tax=Saccharibacillus sp. CPCC 101409 TaxID=3058041 RepID=UPI002673C80D|nr:GNAT family N-acetyltransferase [Saccharibacillus sp. CPCC 101409]MDO3409907.1 GNAT family N-acetyltransferase [Saccharibacillus sp. CPCC 101409]
MEKNLLKTSSAAANIHLEAVTETNFKACIQLSPSAGQRRYVLPVVDCLARAYIYRDVSETLAVCLDDRPVGFMLLRRDPESGSLFLWQFLIDQRCQGRGCGRKAMELIIERARTDGRSPRMTLTCDEDNEAAKNLYRSLGFTVFSTQEGEIDMELRFRA